ncbi:MAG: methyltransferase domain-containing protein, partial [Acidobacteria bacterium]|nr:methyltransferase domain-containing protein [Acidobacteriota bacterium]MCA1651605.1 methyltransferase domain-containing protein [Acidobacteriota bacterium]
PTTFWYITEPMAREVDALTSSTLKHLRERWWDDAFTSFVRDTVQPRAGKQILDVGCGTGTAEVKLSRLRLSQMRLVGVDLVLERVREAHTAVRSHNIRVEFAVADACALPFGESSFDAVFCVAVLQHLRDVEQAVREFARVTRPGGRIVAVEPDNSARYFYSSVDAGGRAYETAGRFFSALARSRGEAADLAVGPKLPALFARIGVEPLDVQLFPVSRSQLGAPPPAIWTDRRAAVEQALEKASGGEVQDLGREYLTSLERYATEAKAAGTAFVEIQHTMLFATVGQREG